MSDDRADRIRAAAQRQLAASQAVVAAYYATHPREPAPPPHRVALRLPDRHADLRAWVEGVNGRRFPDDCRIVVEHPESGCSARSGMVRGLPRTMSAAATDAVRLCRARVRMLAAPTGDVRTLDAIHG